MTDDKRFSKSDRWAPPIIVAAIVGVVPSLIIGLVSNKQTQENDLNNFLRAERVTAYSALTSALITHDNLITRLENNANNGVGYSNAEVTDMQKQVLAQNDALAAAHAQVQIVGSVDVVDAASVAINRHTTASVAFIAIISHGTSEDKRLLDASSEYSRQVSSMVVCNNDLSTLYFSSVANANLSGTAPSRALSNCVDPFELLPEGVEIQYTQ